MILPRKLEILSTIYKVIYVKGPWLVDIDDSPAWQWGKFDAVNTEITVAVQEDSVTLKTLLHELLHGIVWEMNIDEISNHPEEERIINSLSVGLADVLIRNKLLK